MQRTAALAGCVVGGGALMTPDLGQISAPFAESPVLSSAQASEVNWRDYDATLLLEVRRGEKVFTCSGVLVSPKVALTAAHCVVGADSIRASNEFLYHSASPVDGDGPAFENTWHKVLRSRVHPRYAPERSLFAFDAAVVELERPFQSDLSFPRLARQEDELSPGMVVERIGFGGRPRGGAAPLTENRRTLNFPAFLEWVDEGMNATGKAPIAGHLRDSAAVVGDSGGPIFLHDSRSGERVLIGVHSTLTKGTTDVYFPRLSSMRAELGI